MFRPGYLLGKEKCPETGRLKCGAFDRIAANTSVFGKNDPAFIASGFEPFNIWCFGQEVIGKYFDLRTQVAQPPGNQFAAQAMVDKEDDAGEWLGAHAARGISARTISSMSDAGRL